MWTWPLFLCIALEDFISYLFHLNFLTVTHYSYLEQISLPISSVAQSCLVLCNPMGYSTPGFPVHHQLPEPTQTHVICIGDAIQPSHPLLAPSPPPFNLLHNQGLFLHCRQILSHLSHKGSPSGSFPMSWFFTSGGQSIGVSASASVLPMNIQDWFPLEWTGWISLQSKGISRVFSNSTVQKHQFFDAPLSL